MHANFISFHDLSPDGRYQYVSPSVTTLLGYAPSEVVGRPAYDFFRDDEIPACRALHAQTIAQEKVAVVVHCHMRHKQGHFIKVSIVSNLTSGGIVASTCRADEHETLRAREVTGQELHFIESNGVVISKSWTKATSSTTPAEPQASVADVSKTVATAEPTAEPPSPQSWDAAVAAISDARTCLLIDRFTANLKVVFASPNACEIFGQGAALSPPSSPSWIVGRSLLDLVDPSARNRVQEEITKAKAMDGICHLRFRAAPESGESKAAHVVDMVLMCTADALIAIARQALTMSTATISHSDQDDVSMRSWNRRSTTSNSASQTPASASPVPHQLHPQPVYTPGKGLVILTQNEPKYLDFAPPLALLPALGDFDDLGDDDEEYGDEDEEMDQYDEEDSASCVSHAASGVSDTSSALYAPSSVWAQQSTTSTDSDDVDVYARGVNGVIDGNFKLAGDSPQMHHTQHQQQQHMVYRPPPQPLAQGMPVYHAPAPHVPPSTSVQHQQRQLEQRQRQPHANPGPRASRPGYRHHPYRPFHAEPQQYMQRPRASSTFYAYSTPAGSLDQCVELSFYHQNQHQHHQHVYLPGPHHAYASGDHVSGPAYAQAPHQAHVRPSSSGQEYGWVGPSHPQARVFRYRDANALDAAYGMGKGAGGDGSSVDGQVG
ncbi:hypothetical protein BCR44DRAFT_33941 [Catenaria anguillulae PL171]|uniref:PAS domain-containing protein n=1 Tax=Catenaria anguillulae PL171 TaxID=765915 RepID=A0A1Y2HD27_9FUNG|nr:hypothetical protein BCR44DRAFT_33941 [Catenaria anguillulae PL171]